MIDVMATLERLRDERRQNNIIPDSVTFIGLQNEVMRQMRDELNELFAEGKISVKNTLNDKTIIINEHG